jgi:hypothetical protein
MLPAVREIARQDNKKGRDGWAASPQMYALPAATAAPRALALGGVSNE